MKKRILLVVFMIAAVLSAMVFTSCGSKEPMTLEKYVKDNPDVESSIEEATGNSGVEVLIQGNDIIYNFDLSNMEQFTEESAKSDEVITALTDALAAASGTFGGISKQIEDATEIQGIKTTVNYTWGDEVLVTQTFTSADAE